MRCEMCRHDCLCACLNDNFRFVPFFKHIFKTFLRRPFKCDVKFVGVIGDKLRAIGDKLLLCQIIVLLSSVGAGEQRTTSEPQEMDPIATEIP